MAPHNDPVWDYGKRVKRSRFQCNFCNDIYWGTTKRLKAHLAHVSRLNIRKCPNVPPEIRDRCVQWLLDSSSSSSSIQEQVSEVNEIEDKSEEASQEETEEKLQREGAIRVRESVCRFLKSSRLPLETVEDATFVDMFCTIVHCGSMGVPTARELHEIEIEIEGCDVANEPCRSSDFSV